MNIYTILRDENGYACAIEFGDFTILHLQPGTEENEKNVEIVVKRLNRSFNATMAQIDEILDDIE